MKVSTVGPERVLAPEGTHIARCVSIIDMGTKEGENGKYRALNFGFELVEEDADEDGNPVLAFRQFSAKLTPKSHLGQAVTSWLGKAPEGEEFEIGQLAGLPCQITIIHKEVEGKGTFANIKGISGVPKSVKAPKAKSEIKTLFLEKGEFDQDVFDSLPDFIQTDIEGSEEYRALFASQKKGGKTAPAPKVKKSKDVPF